MSWPPVIHLRLSPGDYLALMRRQAADEAPGQAVRRLLADVLHGAAPQAAGDPRVEPGDDGQEETPPAPSPAAGEGAAPAVGPVDRNSPAPPAAAVPPQVIKRRPRPRWSAEQVDRLFKLRDVEQLGWPAIAEHFGLAVTTVMNLYRAERARRPAGETQQLADGGVPPSPVAAVAAPTSPARGEVTVVPAPAVVVEAEPYAGVAVTRCPPAYVAPVAGATRMAEPVPVYGADTVQDWKAQRDASARKAFAGERGAAAARAKRIGEQLQREAGHVAQG